MQLAPIVLFVYNRPAHTRQTLEALAENELAVQSTLYVYADGPKYAASAEDLEKIKAVRELLHSHQWCKEIHIIESEWNKGLADSIVAGVTEVVNHHGRVIVLEDDIVTKVGFLRYMNDALETYADDDRVMHVSGMIYGTPQSVPADGTSFLRVLSCNGWATWRRAWKQYTHDIELLLEQLKIQTISEHKFNIEGGATFYRQLIANRDGRLYTWAVRWYASWLIAGGYSVFPHRSLITNIGHDGSGVHSVAPFYNGEITEYQEVKKIPVVENKELRNELDTIWRKGLRSAQQPSSISLRKRMLGYLQPFRSAFRQASRSLLTTVYPELAALDVKHPEFCVLPSKLSNSTKASTAMLYPPYHIRDSQVGEFSYVSHNSWISLTHIGKFCSIGPNFCCGWGIHPLEGISTSPMFYSRSRQNGTTLSPHNKVQERKPIHIGNDVFIGMNVTILDGVSVGDGSVIGAGAVVAKDVPPYAIVAGNPLQILRYRFPEDVVQKLQEIAWWDWSLEELQQVEKHFFNIDSFIVHALVNRRIKGSD